MEVGRRALVFGALGAIGASTVACGKKRGPPPPLVWLDDVELATSEANGT